MADEPGMDKGDLRKLLTVAKTTPVNAAIGIGKDGSPVVLLHKIKQPRALSKELEASGGDVKNMRWGELHADDNDPKTLIARLNKPSSGLARKLIKTVRLAGFAKVVLQFEDGTTEEGLDDEPDDAPPEPAAAAAPEAASPQTAAAPAPQAAAKPDFGPVTARVVGLAKRMLPLIAANPSGQDELKSRAKAAQSALQSHNLEAAETAAGAFEQAIAKFEAATAPAPTQAPADAATIAKARTAWLGIRKRVEGELNKLLDAIRVTYKEHGAAAEIERQVQSRLGTVLAALDEDLADKLEAMNKAAGAERQKLVAEAHQIITRYEKHVTTDAVVASLDGNPFVPLAVQKTVTAALSALSHTIH